VYATAVYLGEDNAGQADPRDGGFQHAYQLLFQLDNRGSLDQGRHFFYPNYDRQKNSAKGSDFPGGEPGRVFMNGNVMCSRSPGDNDLLRILAEDAFPRGHPPSPDNYQRWSNLAPRCAKFPRRRR
jgi:hypothetical protein